MGEAGGEFLGEGEDVGVFGGEGGHGCKLLWIQRLACGVLLLIGSIAGFFWRVKGVVLIFWGLIWLVMIMEKVVLC